MEKWSEYYRDHSVNVDLYIRNLYGHKYFLNAITQDSPQKILEIGAGTGSMSIFLSHLNIEVTTLDNDTQIIEQAKITRQKFGGKNKLVLGNAFKLPFENGSYDAVFHQGLLEHFSDEEIYRLLDEQLRVAKTVYISVPNNIYPEKDFGDERLLSKNRWDEILAKKYRIEWSTNYSPKFFPKWYILRAKIQYMAKIRSSQV